MHLLNELRTKQISAVGSIHTILCSNISSVADCFNIPHVLLSHYTRISG
jgi:hypothetical protein